MVGVVGGGGGSPLENHKLLYVSLEILVQWYRPPSRRKVFGTGPSDRIFWIVSVGFKSPVQALVWNKMLGWAMLHAKSFPVLNLYIWLCWIKLLIEPVHEIFNNGVCATSKASDQPAHTRSLIRAFADRLSILWLLSYWMNTIWSF